MVIEYILLGVIKVVDNIISTYKNIAIYKGLKILSSALVFVSQLIFYLIIGQIVEDNTLKAILIVAFGSAVGNYFALVLDDKFARDEKWTVILTCSCVEDVKDLCNYLAQHKIKYIASDGYNKQGDHTINVMAFSKTKDESRLIDEYLENTDHKYFKEVLK
jgi:apolipoprotein N-acyltransferase